MNPVKRIPLLIPACTLGLFLISCAHTLPGFESEGWKQLAAAANAQTKRSGKVSMQFAWNIPNQRVLMLARQSEDQAILYQIDRVAGLKADDSKKQVSCYFERDQLLCAGPGETAPSVVAVPGADLWMAIESHASVQMDQVNKYTRSSIQTQLTSQHPSPNLDLTKQRHPFEWGGEHETIENAQAFLEAVTAKGVPFHSEWPKAPNLGSQGNSWQNEEQLVNLKTTGQCLSLATSDARTAIHSNHDFWDAETVDFKTVYRWQQPIDWNKIEGVKINKDQDGVFLFGSYSGAFQDQGLAYVSGWSPDVLTANANMFDPSKYSVTDWNLNLKLPSTSGLRERVLYAVTYLDIMCGRRGTGQK